MENNLMRNWAISILIMCAMGDYSIMASDSEEENQAEPWAVADRVTNLPGQPQVQFQHYSGYVKLRSHDQKALFYWFFEAQDEPSQKPLVLWLNGGPGCSSVAFGAAQEVGPFLVHSSNGTQLTLNEYSWNKVANILFLESPVGVGFSYTNNSDDLFKLGDQVTAIDALSFLLGWFKRFPDFKSHDFYMVGESYGGHYVPQLADLIYERNKAANRTFSINLKGLMLGNAVINDDTDSLGFVEYAWSHAIISDKLYHSLRKDCNDFRPINRSSHCIDHLNAFFVALADIDIFNIYSPVCLNSLIGATTFRNATIHDLRLSLPSGSDPCLNNYVVKYFNKQDVQKALHANITKLSYPYTSCSGIIKNWTDTAYTVLPTILKLLNVGMRIWIYSGDMDGRVPVTSTKYSINRLNLQTKEEWRPWFQNCQVGGWVETYEKGLTFVTVRGAGHQVPLSAPDRSLSLITNFLSASNLPSSHC